MTQSQHRVALGSDSALEFGIFSFFLECASWEMEVEILLSLSAKSSHSVSPITGCMDLKSVILKTDVICRDVGCSSGWFSL